MDRPTTLRLDTVEDVAGSVNFVSASRDLVLLAVPRKKWKRSSKNAFITSFVTDFQTSDMYALVVATHVCSSEDGNDDGINFWIDNFLLSQC